MKLIAKAVIPYTITTLTGLRIGSEGRRYEIGEPDITCVANPISGEPYIPGSSIKGKMRALIERTELDDDKLEFLYEVHKEIKEREKEITKLYKERRKEEAERKKAELNDFIKDKIKELEEKGWKISKRDPLVVYHECTEEDCPICNFFGRDSEKAFSPTRIKVGDTVEVKVVKNGAERPWKNSYYEIKGENTVDRITSKANPRQVKRVPAGVVFRGEIILDIYSEDFKDGKYKYAELLKEAVDLINSDTLGSSGSRGYGRVKFELDLENAKYISYAKGKEEDKRDIIKKSLGEAFEGGE